MIKFMKRIGAVLLCFCMLMPMCPEQAWAAQDLLSDVYVNIELPKVGRGEQKVIYTAVEEEKYEVICEKTATPDGATVDDYWWGANYAIATEFTGNGNDYIAKFTVIPKGNYGLTANTRVFVNGKEAGVNLVGGNDSPASVFTFTTEVEEPIVLSEINLSNLPTGAIGDVATQYNYDGGSYTVVGDWLKYDYTAKTYIPMNTVDKFEQGQMYQLTLKISTKEGYLLAQNVKLFIDGENIGPNRGCFEFNAWHSIDVNYTAEIDVIEISSADLPKAEVGMTFTDTVIKVPVKEGSHYTASGSWVYSNPDTGMEERAGTFQDGKEYRFVLDIIPSTGYSLSEECEFYLDGEREWDCYIDSSHLVYNARASFKDVIDKVTLLNLPTATVGGTVKAGNFDVEVPAGAPYTATARWLIYAEAYGWDYVTATTFEDGNKYRLSVSIEPKEGYEFAEATIVNAYGVDVKSYAGTDFSWFEKDFSFLKEISSVEITGYTEPKIGDSAATNVATLKVPADANYEIIMAQWWELTPESAEVMTTFEKGKDYALDVFVAPKAGYEFTKGTTVTINGNEVNANILDVELYAAEFVSFKEVITEVQISNVPTMEIGKTTATDVKVPDGAKYKAIAMWRVWDDAKREYVAFEGVFETGKVYELGVIVTPEDGYRFSDEETVFKIDENTIEPSELLSNSLIYNKGYQTEHKVIDRIELKIEEPVVGNHSSIEPLITIVGDANFSIIEDEGAIWWLIGTADKFTSADREYFVADETYGVYFMIQANEGYVFADDLVIVINGKVIPKDAYTNALKLADVCYFFGIGIEEVKDEPVTAPKTGDDSPIGLWMTFFMVGIFVCSNAMMGRKRR